MLNGGSDRKSFTENDQGTGPATLRSPASSAFNDDQADTAPESGFEPDDDGAALELEQEYRRRLAGMRRLGRPVRAAAYRAAREWFRASRVELREKQTRKRQARALEWRLLRRPRWSPRAGLV